MPCVMSVTIRVTPDVVTVGYPELYLLGAGLADYRWFDARDRLRAAGQLLRDEKLRMVSAEQWEMARRKQR